MRWSIEIKDFLGGFAPLWFTRTYPTYGNKNHAGAMLNVDLTGPALTQGPGLADLTNGNQSGVVTTLINSILDQAVASDVTYGIGGNLLYRLTSTTVTSGSSGISWPHTIDKTGVTGESGSDVALYQGNLYYSYNHSSNGGDIGKYNLNATAVDDWWTSTASGATLQNVTGSYYPHQMVVGLNDVLYIANGRYVASYDGSTAIAQALDLPVGTVIQSMVWNSNRLYIAANHASIIGNNKILSSIYIWDGTTDSWETEINIAANIRCLYIKNSVVYLFYQDITSIGSGQGGYKLAYLSGISVIDLTYIADGQPNFPSVTNYRDFIIWSTGQNTIYAYGSGHKDLPARLFQLSAEGTVGSPGALASPFGTPLIASTNTTSTWRLAKFSGYTVSANWKSLMFDITASGQIPKVDFVRINFDALASGARVDWKLLNSAGTTVYSDTISFSKLGAVTTAFYNLNGKVTSDFRIEFDYTNGSTTNPITIRNAKIYGSSN